MREGWIEVGGDLVTRAQLRVLRAIDETAAAPKIGEFHRMTEIRLESQRLIRRIAYDAENRISAWVVTENGQRILDELRESDALPRSAEALGRSFERI